MNDIVERLFNQSLRDGNSTLMQNAANEIESLRQQLDDLFEEKRLLSKRVATLTEERQWLLDDVAKFRGERNALRDELAALKAGRNALAEFNEHWQEDDGNDPIERLRFFCSLAMRGQDWLDVEPFFDELKQSQGEPVYYEITLVDGTRFVAANRSILKGAKSKPLYTSAPTIPEGWQVAPIDPTPEMLLSGFGEGGNSAAIYKAMLDAAPKPEDL